MNLTTGIRLLQVLNARPEDALTVRQITDRWLASGWEAVDKRSIQRYMQELSTDGTYSADKVGGQRVVEVITTEREHRYYLPPARVANWFMTEEAALDLQLTQQVLGRAFGARGKSNQKKLADMADQITAASPETKRIRDRLRIVPDGIGRLPARIEPKSLQTAIAAIGKDRKLTFVYTNPAGKVSNQAVSPLGLVAKDGTIYLVAAKGLGDTPRHYAMQRMSNSEIHFQPSQGRADFDLDRHIRESHQFSHSLDADAPPITLNMRVSPEAIFHFRERPLSADQAITDPTSVDGWYTVTAKVPHTLLLVPFLVSMGPNVEVLMPVNLRSKVAQWLRDAGKHYLQAGGAT